MAEQYAFAVIGSGVMGGNLALNIESRGYPVVLYDVDESRVKVILERAKGRLLHGSPSLSEMLGVLERPRKILLMVPAGPVVDTVLNNLRPLLEAGDIVIDGGNSYYEDTARRVAQMESDGKLMIGMGTSGGEEGALTGPALMPGGSEAAWSAVRPILEAIAAKAPGGEPCCRWMGPGGAGHFVKMVHNGIEYADMQVIGEAYHLMRHLLGMTTLEVSQTLEEWQTSELKSYLIEITALVLRKADPESHRPMVEMILDRAEQKGTGAWTAQAALALGVPTPTIAEAVFARSLSALKDERQRAAGILGEPGNASQPPDRPAWLEKIRHGLYATKIIAYAQGFALMQAASDQYHWGVNLHDVAATWRAGCIIRAGFLDRIIEAYAGGQPENILLHQSFAQSLRQTEKSLREVVTEAAGRGLWTPAFMSALAYLDGYRSRLLPANLLQAQRDFFGSHMVERVDRPGHVHLDWDSLKDLDAGPR